MTRSILVPALLSLSMAAGCGTQLEGVGGGGGQGSTTTSTTSSTTTTTSSSTEPSSCAKTLSLDISFEDTDGTKYACGGPQVTTSVDIDAVVVKVEGGAITLDKCAPNVDCVGQLVTLHVDGEGLVVPIPLGTFVHVHFDIDSYIACPVYATVTNLASWGGVPNPATNAPLTWIKAAVGDHGPCIADLNDVGFTATDAMCTGGQQGDMVYDCRFFDLLHPDNTTLVHTGATGTLHVQRDTGAEVWTFGVAREGCYHSPTSSCPSEGDPFDHWFTQAPE